VNWVPQCRVSANAAHDPDDNVIALAPEAPPEQLGGTAGVVFTPTDWSPDGTRLGGSVATPAGPRLAVYDFVAQRITRQFEVPFNYARWLPDNRHLIFFNEGVIETLDTLIGWVLETISATGC
jgi:hypothetical protein